jgi:hypothetical protein
MLAFVVLSWLLGEGRTGAALALVGVALVISFIVTLALWRTNRSTVLESSGKIAHDCARTRGISELLGVLLAHRVQLYADERPLTIVRSCKRRSRASVLHSVWKCRASIRRAPGAVAVQPRGNRERHDARRLSSGLPTRGPESSRGQVLAVAAGPDADSDGVRLSAPIARVCNRRQRQVLLARHSITVCSRGQIQLRGAIGSSFTNFSRLLRAPAERGVRSHLLELTRTSATAERGRPLPPPSCACAAPCHSASWHAIAKWRLATTTSTTPASNAACSALSPLSGSLGVQALSGIGHQRGQSPAPCTGLGPPPQARIDWLTRPARRLTIRCSCMRSGAGHLTRSPSGQVDRPARPKSQ